MDRDDFLYLEGLAGFDVVFTQIKAGTKCPTRVWGHFEELHDKRGESRIDLACEWLRKGLGVGYLLRNRLGAVDADALSTVMRISDFEERDIYTHFPKVHTPRGGIHAHFVHPPDIDMSRLKNHVCHPKEDGVRVPWDFKLGTRTMLMAPGTVMEKGVYKAEIWHQPPVLDVRHLAPELDLYRTEREFLRDTRTIKNRMMAAMTYLELKAPVCVEGKKRRNTLRTVAEHIVGFYDLDPSLAFHLLTKSKEGSDKDGKIVKHVAWNQRCLNAEGIPSPWSEQKLWEALEDAVDAAPAFGVKLLEDAQEKEFARWSAAAFIEILTHLPEPTRPIWIKADTLYGAFIEFSGVKPEAFLKCELGLELTREIAQGRLPFVFPDRNNADGRIYRGVDLHTLRFAMDTFEQRQNLIDVAS